MVIGFNYGYGQAGCKTGDSTNLPAVSQLFRSSHSVEWKRVTIAGYKIMGGVERGKAATQSCIDGVDLLAVPRGVVQRFAESVADESLQTPASVPPIDLRGVVSGVADAREVGIVAKWHDEHTVNGSIAIRCAEWSACAGGY